jgi:hypothetical protein
LFEPVVDSLHPRLLGGHKSTGCHEINPVTPVRQRNAIVSGDSSDYLLQMENIRFDLPMIHSLLQGRCYFYFLSNEFDATRGTDNRFRCHKLDALRFAQCAKHAARTKAAQARKDFLQSIETGGVLYIPQMRNSKNAISRHLGSANYPHDRRKWMLLESDQYDHAVNAIYETLTQPRAWHAVFAAIAGLIGARAVWITVNSINDKQSANPHSESFGNLANKNHYNVSGNRAAESTKNPIESFARFELDQKSADSGNIIASAHISSRPILDTGKLLVTLVCEFDSEREALVEPEPRWLDRLMPHLSRAAQLQDVRYFATPELFARVPVLDEWRQPAMLVALNGTLLRFNDATTQMLGRTRLVQVAEGKLELQGAAQRQILEECHAAVDVTPAYRMLRLTEDHHDESTGQDALYVFYHRSQRTVGTPRCSRSITRIHRQLSIRICSRVRST